MEQLSSPEGKVSGYLAIPKKGDGPGVLVFHAWWGLNDFFKGLCDQLATAGFVAFAPDLYHGATASTREEAESLVAKLDLSKLGQTAVGKDIANSLRGLRAHPQVRGKRLGVVGFSLGAFFGLWLAEEFPEAASAIVLFYGTREGNYTKTDAAFLGHFADADEFEPTAAVRDLETLLRSVGKDVTFHTYPGTAHWFFEADRSEAYDARAAELAWQRTIRFLKTQLSGKAMSD